jgi:glycosyltransferase involved in cell wall biosynthesis
MRVAAIYLYKNEAEFLPISVRSVWDSVNEVHLINNCSADGSAEIANALHRERPHIVRLHHSEHDFDTVPEWKQRQQSLLLARAHWVMIMDADQVMSDGWRQAVEPALRNRQCDGISVRFEHCVGGIEYIHKEFYEKQKNPELHPHVPLYQMCLFRKTRTLQCRPAAWSCPQFREFHHSRFDESIPKDRRQLCGDAKLWHLGFLKQDMHYISSHRIRRGDYGFDAEKQNQMIGAMAAERNPFKYVGWVQRADYGQEHLPSMLREWWGRYELELDKDGFIQKRTHKPTGVVG